VDHSARPICAISTVTTAYAVPEHASSRAEGFIVEVIPNSTSIPFPAPGQGMRKMAVEVRVYG
jgi:hypothetical protein